MIIYIIFLFFLTIHIFSFIILIILEFHIRILLNAIEMKIMLHAKIKTSMQKCS